MECRQYDDVTEEIERAERDRWAKAYCQEQLTTLQTRLLYTVTEFSIADSILKVSCFLCNRQCATG